MISQKRAGGNRLCEAPAVPYSLSHRNALLLMRHNTRITATLPINPAAGILGAENAVLSGTSRTYYVPDFEGPLSIKTVVRGSAVWRAGGRDFRVNEGCYLVLNDRSPYTITIDSATPSTTFCIFFERGFVEDVFRSLRTPAAGLLDQPEGPPAIEFPEHLTPSDPLSRRIADFRMRLLGNQHDWPQWEDAFIVFARELAARERDLRTASERLRAVRPSTRQEVQRRVLRGRDALLSSSDTRVRLKDVARAAGMSSYHFHRSFRQLYGATPHQYLLRYRLERAARLLADSDASVTDIGLSVGFDNAAAFSTSFRGCFGLSPRAFRQK